MTCLFFPLSSHHEYQPPHPPHSPSPSPRSPITLSWQSTYTFRKCRDIQSSPGHAVGLLKAILLTQVHFHLSATLQKVGINKGEKRCTFTFNFVWMRNFSNSSLLAGEKGVNRLLSPTPSAHTHTHTHHLSGATTRLSPSHIQMQTKRPGAAVLYTAATALCVCRQARANTFGLAGGEWQEWTVFY